MASLITQIKKTYALAGARESREVLNNAAFLSGLQTVVYILPALVLPYLFRILGPDKFGLICFAQAFLQYFIILTDYGFSVTATKDISLCRHLPMRVNAVFSSVMTVKLLIVALSFVAIALLVLFIPRFRQDWIIYALGLGTILGSALFPLWFFQGMEKMANIAKLNIIGELASAFSIFAFIRTADDFWKVPLISSAVMLTTGLWGQWIIRKKFKARFRPQPLSHIISQLKNGWNVFISVVAINAYTTTRIFIVGLLTNNTLTGFYSVAEKIASVAQTFPLSSFSQAIFPRLSKIFQKNKHQAYTIMQQVQQITVNISLICLPVLLVFAPRIIKLVCGGDFPEAVTALRLLLLAVFFVSANAFRVQFLLVAGRTKTYSRIHITMALIGAPMLTIFVYRFSYMGAALATVLIEASVFTATWFTVRKIFERRKPFPWS